MFESDSRSSLSFRQLAQSVTGHSAPDGMVACSLSRIRVTPSTSRYTRRFSSSSKIRSSNIGQNRRFTSTSLWEASSPNLSRTSLSRGKPCVGQYSPPAMTGIPRGRRSPRMRDQARVYRLAVGVVMVTGISGYARFGSPSAYQLSRVSPQ